MLIRPRLGLPLIAVVAFSSALLAFTLSGPRDRSIQASMTAVIQTPATASSSEAPAINVVDIGREDYQRMLVREGLSAVAGLRPGDTIRSINDQSADTWSEIDLLSLQSSSVVDLAVHRGNDPLRVIVLVHD